MKIAIVITGQPRQLEQGAHWFKNYVFPKGCGLEVDYFCYFWDDGTSDLRSRIENTYNPVRYHVQEYEKNINNFISHVQARNNELNDWKHVPEKFRNLHLFDVDNNHISNYSKNIWGQFFCSYKANKMLGSLDNYDIVIRTRSDVAFNNMDIAHWRSAFSNIYRNPIFDDKMFVPWLYIERGIPLFSDFAFISKPKVWHQFNSNLEEACFAIATDHKQLWYELEVSEFKHHPHWIWNKMAMHSRTNMLSFSVTWPMPFDCKLIRYPEKLEDLNFDYINQQHMKYEVENPIKS